MISTLCYAGSKITHDDATRNEIEAAITNSSFQCTKRRINRCIGWCYPNGKLDKKYLKFLVRNLVNSPDMCIMFYDHYDKSRGDEKYKNQLRCGSAYIYMSNTTPGHMTLAIKNDANNWVKIRFPVINGKLRICKTSYEYIREFYERIIDICCICLNDPHDKEIIMLGCGHKLHTECLKKMENFQHKKCPLCRADISHGKKMKLKSENVCMYSIN